MSRWLPLAPLLLVWLGLLLHKSSDAVLFGRYSSQFLVLWLAVGTWPAAWAWIALRDSRWQRFRDRLKNVPWLALCLLIGTFLVLLDFVAPVVGALLSPIGFALVLCPPLGAVLAASDEPRTNANVLASITVSCTVALFLTEAVFRFFLVAGPPVSGKDLDAWLPDGWRTVALEKPTGVTRLVGIGDSFGTAGKEKNFHPLLLERLKNEKLEEVGNYELLNLSVSAYQLPDQLAMVQRHALRYQPDILLHSFFVGNDFEVTRPLKRYRDIPVDDRGLLRHVLPSRFLIRDWLRLRAQARADQRQIKKESLKESQAVPKADQGTFSEEAFLNIELRRMETICRRSETPLAKRWAKVTRHLDQIRDLVENAGATYVLVIHPDQFQVEEALRAEVLRRFNRHPENYDLQQPQRFLKDFCTSRGVLCIDLLEDFQEQEAKRGGLYRLRDTHYNDRGNALAAAVIARELLKARD